MAISFESESKIQLFTLKGVLDASMTAWTIETLYAASTHRGSGHGDMRPASEAIEAEVY